MWSPGDRQMRFLKTYGRVLGLLGRDIRIAGFLAFANLMVAGLQFLDPVLFGRVVNLLSRSDNLPQSQMWHEAAMLLGIWVCRRHRRHRQQHRRGLADRAAGASASYQVDGAVFHACAESAAVLSRRDPFRASDQVDADRHRRAVRHLAGVLPRPVVHHPVGRRAAADDAVPELAPRARADRAGRGVPGASPPSW